MKNPSKYLRKAYIKALKDTGIKIYDKRIPVDVEVPDTYIILSTQTKNETNETKCGKDWECSILLDIVSIQERGFADSSIVDDIEEQVDDLVNIRAGIEIDGFRVYSTSLESSAGDEIETDSQYISRKLVRYKHVLGINQEPAD